MCRDAMLASQDVYTMLASKTVYAMLASQNLCNELEKQNEQQTYHSHYHGRPGQYWS